MPAQRRRRSALLLCVWTTNAFLAPPKAPHTIALQALDSFMVGRLDDMRGTFDELTARLADPDVLDDPDKMLQISKQRADAEEVVNAYEEYQNLEEELSGATEMFQEADDQEMRELAREEVKDLEERIKATEDRLALLLIPKDPMDEKNVMLEIRAGTGGDEASLFAGDLLRMYHRYADSLRWRMEVMSSSASDVGGERPRRYAADGTGGASVVVEEFLEGEECSVFAITDGEAILILEPVVDHKQVGEGDTGPNTGGMGVYSPAPSLGSRVLRQVEQRVVIPSIHAVRREGIDFRGVLFIGLMLTESGPKVLEYNVRFGDPEAQALVRRFSDDLLPYLLASAEGSLKDMDPPTWDRRFTVGVIAAAVGVMLILTSAGSVDRRLEREVADRARHREDPHRAPAADERDEAPERLDPPLLGLEVGLVVLRDGDRIACPAEHAS